VYVKNVVFTRVPTHVRLRCPSYHSFCAGPVRPGTIHHRQSSPGDPVCIGRGLLRGRVLLGLMPVGPMDSTSQRRPRDLFSSRRFLMKTTRGTGCGRAVALVVLGLVLRCIPRDCIVQSAANMHITTLPVTILLYMYSHYRSYSLALVAVAVHDSTSDVGHASALLVTYFWLDRLCQILARKIHVCQTFPLSTVTCTIARTGQY